MALMLMLVGMLFKVSAAPFHVWTPDVYEGAPSPVVALCPPRPKPPPSLCCSASIYEMLPALRSIWSPLLWVVAVLSMTIGNLAALRQQNVKRMLAYSSIAHAGYLLAAFAGLGTNRHRRRRFYTAAYAAMNVGIFAVVTLASGYDEQPAVDSRLPRPALSLPAARHPAYLLPDLARRNSLHRRLLRQVLLPSLPRWAAEPSSLAIIGLLNSGWPRRITCAWHSRPHSARRTAKSPHALPSRRWDRRRCGACVHRGRNSVRLASRPEAPFCAQPKWLPIPCRFPPERLQPAPAISSSISHNSRILDAG